MKRTTRRRAPWRPTNSLLDVLSMSPTQPLRPAQYRTQLTRMHLALDAMLHERAPAAGDWRHLVDAFNLVEQLTLAGLAHDEAGLIAQAQAALVQAHQRHTQSGQPLRLDGEGIAACRQLLATWHAALQTLPARTIVQTEKTLEKRLHAAYVNPAISADRVVTL